MQYESQDRAVGIRTIRLNSSLELISELNQWLNGDFRYIEKCSTWFNARRSDKSL